MKIPDSICEAIQWIGAECEAGFYVTPKEERQAIVDAVAGLLRCVTIGHENVTAHESGTFTDLQKNAGRFEAAYNALPKGCRW